MDGGVTIDHPTPATKAEATRDDALVVAGLTVALPFAGGSVAVVDDVGLRIGDGEIVGLVGETGCGKTMTALSILGLTPAKARVTGSIRLAGQELVGTSETQWRAVRGARVGYVPQDATAALDPVLTVGSQIREGIRAHQRVSRREASHRAAELLRSVGIPDARARLSAYPHQLSGGMRQRVAIAIALCCDPQLIVADEPTTALDATVQAQIIDLLSQAASERRVSVLLISHDLRLVAGATSRVNVMYAGRIVEHDSARRVMHTPAHPYTRALLDSTPRLRGQRSHRLPAIPGRPPDPRALPDGCRFHPRCPHSQPVCEQREPLLGMADSRAACWFPLTQSSREGEG